MPAGESYQEELISKAPGLGGRLGELASSSNVRAGAGSLMLWMALSKIFEAASQRGEQNVRREAIRSQAELATPENLYYQASLPSAQAEEEQARQALLAHLSGGVIGPSLARGERLVGG